MLALRSTILFSAVLLAGVLAACAQDKAAQPLAPMARDANPSFEVATIKPADPDDRNQGFRLNGHRISIESNTLASIFCFAYSIHKSQIVNAPQWFNEQTWNIDGVPDADGKPSWPQYRKMLQKLLSTRFGLVMHPDKRDLSVYALTIAKGGAKLEKTKSEPDALSDASGHGVGPAQYMKFTNNSMADFAQVMQLMVDKPVVDQTNLSGHYDFVLQWTPDSLRATPTDSAPGLFTAVQEQLGLKLEATRAPTDVFVIDAATRPTQN
jgi:uncharacterized protein (TIGR03435 family)